MRYWILSFTFSALYLIVMALAAPEQSGSNLFYVGLAGCSLLALVLTWKDKKNGGDEFIEMVMNAIIPLAGIGLLVYGGGYQLGYFRNIVGSDVFTSPSIESLSYMSLMAGLFLIITTVLRIWLSHKHKG